MANGGYDDGYSSCSCFWGIEPADLVIKASNLFDSKNKKNALDLGCGEGKNSFYLFKSGFNVTAVDISDKALSNARLTCEDSDVNFIQVDLTSIKGPHNYFDLVIATGSLHCLPETKMITETIETIKNITKPGGINVITGFDDGLHNMSGHDSSFTPSLLPHEEYLALYSEWEILSSSSVIQNDMHPNNGIEHSHSITRLMARKKNTLSLITNP